MPKSLICTVNQHVVEPGDIRGARVTAQLLITGAEVVATQAVAEQGAEGVVVDAAATVVHGTGVADIRLEATSLVQRHLVYQID